jgi:hypothetical protein
MNNIKIILTEETDIRCDRQIHRRKTYPSKAFSVFPMYLMIFCSKKYQYTSKRSYVNEHNLSTILRYLGIPRDFLQQE